MIKIKKINSNSYGGKILAAGAVMGLLIPAIIKVVNMCIHIYVLNLIAKIFFCTGGFILIGFFIYLFIELRQDHKIDVYYSSHKNIRIKLENGEYECTNCGNRKVKKEDTYCNICGNVFSKEKDLDPQSILLNKK